MKTKQLDMQVEDVLNMLTRQNVEEKLKAIDVQSLKILEIRAAVDRIESSHNELNNTYERRIQKFIERFSVLET